MTEGVGLALLALGVVGVVVVATVSTAKQSPAPGGLQMLPVPPYIEDRSGAAALAARACGCRAKVVLN